jgi:hexosaminidase
MGVTMQANLWTEFISDEATAEYMLLPRLCALAECVWSPVEARNWQGFIDRTHGFLDRLSLAGYNYRPLQYKHSGSEGPLFTGAKDSAI